MLSMRIFKERLKSILRERFCRCRHDARHSELRCAIEKCTTLYGFGLRESDWHYLASTMRQYLAAPQMRIEETHLWSYFHQFQPENMYEALFGKWSEDQGCKSALSVYRDPERGPMPWTSDKDLRLGAHKAEFAGDYGPWPNVDIVTRFERIKGVCDAIRQHGYEPGRAAHEEDTIRGVLLKKGDDWRMVILGGNHRSCALAALGYSHIPVRHDRTLPAMLDLANVQQWPCVRVGVLPANVALKVASLYFEDSGNAKAKAYGLL